jgi:hypothetical protein
MLSSSFFDIAIGIVFVFLLLSLIASTINEIIQSFLNLRGKKLLLGLQTLLNDTGGNMNGLVEKLYNHGQIFGLFEGTFNPQKPSNLPSYIPTKNFVMALLDVVPAAAAALPALSPAPAPPAPDPNAAARAALQAAEQAAQQTAQLAAQLSARVGAAPPDGVAAAQAAAAKAVAAAELAALRLAAQKLASNDSTKKVGIPVLSMIGTAGTDLDHLKTNVEDWFNSAMDRVSGWYKYRTQKMLFCIGLILAIALNANTIVIVQQLSKNPTLRESIVAAAQSAAAKEKKTEQGNKPDPAKNPDQAATPDQLNKANQKTEQGNKPEQIKKPDQANNPDPAKKSELPNKLDQPSNPGQGNNPNQGASSDISTNLKGLSEQINKIEGLGVPLGWTKQDTSALGNPTTYLGWLLTAIAVSLGAPFWFDILNKFMIVRSTVKPGEKSHTSKEK